jgi:hypothetical protein
MPPLVSWNKLLRYGNIHNRLRSLLKGEEGEKVVLHIPTAHMRRNVHQIPSGVSISTTDTSA